MKRLTGIVLLAAVLAMPIAAQAHDIRKDSRGYTIHEEIKARYQNKYSNGRNMNYNRNWSVPTNGGAYKGRAYYPNPPRREVAYYPVYPGRRLVQYRPLPRPITYYNLAPPPYGHYYSCDDRHVFLVRQNDNVIVQVLSLLIGRGD